MRSIRNQSSAGRLAACGLAAALTLAACASRKVDPENTYRAGEGSADMEEALTSSVLGRKLEILSPIHKRNESGFLVCQFDLHNKQKSQVNMEWTVDWFDSTGFKIDTNEHWRPQVLGGGAVETVQIIGPTTDAARWKLRVRTSSAIR